MDEIQQGISTAVEVQVGATGAIGESVSVAARSSDDIARSVASVAVATETTHDGATHTEGAATELASLARRLNELAGQFRR
jgi:methyl-accepting chemotaxis protein